MRGFALSAVLVVCVCRHPTAGAPLRPPLARAPLDVRGGGPNFFAGESSPFDASSSPRIENPTFRRRLGCAGVSADASARAVDGPWDGDIGLC